MGQLRFYIALIILFMTLKSEAQSISEQKVPSVIVNNFKKKYPKAFDVDWEKHNKMYCVYFSTIESSSQEVWYNESMETVKHVEEIVLKQVPEKIKNVIDTNYKKFKLDDLKKITIGKSIRYLIELDSKNEELEITFNEQGEVLSKIKSD